MAPIAPLIFFTKSSPVPSLKENGTTISENFDTKKPQSGERNLSEIFEVVTENGDKFYAENLVVASGGLSYKSLGASDIGYKIARDFGVAVAPPAPALVGFTAQKDEFWFKNLSGVCFPVRIIVGYAQSGRQGSGDESDLPCKGAAKACENASGASRNENNFSAPYKDSSVSSGDQALLQTGNASPLEKAVPPTFSKSDKKIEFNKPNARQGEANADSKQTEERSPSLTTEYQDNAFPLDEHEA